MMRALLAFPLILAQPAMACEFIPYTELTAKIYAIASARHTINLETEAGTYQVFVDEWGNWIMVFVLPTKIACAVDTGPAIAWVE